MFENRRTDELVRIAAARGGFEINVGPRSTQELIQIAQAASAGRGKVIGARQTDPRRT